MHAVGLLGSGSGGLVSVSEPGGLLVFFSERNNCERFN